MSEKYGRLLLSLLEISNCFKFIKQFHVRGKGMKFPAFPFLKIIGPCNRWFPSSRFFLTMLLIKADELVQYSSLCFIGSFLLRS
jgi:hypothetical protein